MNQGFSAARYAKCLLSTRSGAVAAALAYTLATPTAHSFQLETGNPDLKVRWDNTVKYSAAWRLRDPSAALVSEANQDDGDRNFKKGLISNRVDLLTEMDVVFGNFGGRVSGAAWYDDIYNRSNDNNSPGTVNHVSRPFNEFTKSTEKLHGRKGELLDAFIFGKGTLGEGNVSFRLGRHALLWGESLFVEADGIEPVVGLPDPEAYLHAALPRILGVHVSTFRRRKRAEEPQSFGPFVKHVIGFKIAASCRKTMLLPAPLVVRADGDVRGDLPLAGHLLCRPDQFLELGIGDRQTLDDVDRRHPAGDTIGPQEQALTPQ